VLVSGSPATGLLGRWSKGLGFESFRGVQEVKYSWSEMLFITVRVFIVKDDYLEELHDSFYR